MITMKQYNTIETSNRHNEHTLGRGILLRYPAVE